MAKRVKKFKSALQQTEEEVLDDNWPVDVDICAVLIADYDIPFVGEEEAIVQDRVISTTVVNQLHATCLYVSSTELVQVIVFRLWF